jgi:hypothetical protein
MTKEEEPITLPVEKRHCTDVFCLLLLLGVWLCMTLIGMASIGRIQSTYFRKGDPELLIHGVDYQGNICGVSPVVEHLPKQVFPNFFGITLDSKNNLVPILTAICAGSCPDDGETVSDPYGHYGTWKITEDTIDFVNTCLYLDENRDNTSGTTVISDFLKTYSVIAVLGFALAVVCSLTFLFITRIPLVLRTVVWTSIALIFCICIGGGYYLIHEAHSASDRADGNSLNKTEVKFCFCSFFCFLF